MNQFLSIPIWHRTPQCPITNNSDILVYCRVLQTNKNNRLPQKTQVAWSTGLSRQTVITSLNRLEALGMMEGTRAIPHPGFCTDRYWNCLVTDDTAKISVEAAQVYSFLLHNISQKPPFNPKRGYSVRYLEKALMIDEDTIRASLKTLAKWQLHFPPWGVCRFEKWLPGQCKLFRKQNDIIPSGKLEDFEPDESAFQNQELQFLDRQLEEVQNPHIKRVELPAVDHFLEHAIKQQYGDQSHIVVSELNKWFHGEDVRGKIQMRQVDVVANKLGIAKIVE